MLTVMALSGDVILERRRGNGDYQNTAFLEVPAINPGHAAKPTSLYRRRNRRLVLPG